MCHFNTVLKSLCLGLMAIVLAHPAAAAEGIIQINQANALEGGVTTNDLPGFPVSIKESGSFILTGDLQTPDTATTAIEVTVDWVTIDLNGFRIDGQNSCSWGGSSVSCTVTTGGDGIKVTSPSTQKGLTVRNGTIRGAGHHGIDGGSQAIIEGVRAVENGGDGIHVVDDSILTGNRMGTNGGYGLYFGNGNTVMRNSASQNDEAGIRAYENNTICNNMSSVNGGYGIYGWHGNTVCNNTTNANINAGIYVNQKSTIFNNTSDDNGADGIAAGSGSNIEKNTTRWNSGHGVSTNGPGRVYGNTSANNTRRGLRMQSTVGYAENVLLGNGEGNVESGTQMGTNFCETNTTCP